MKVKVDQKKVDDFHSASTFMAGTLVESRQGNQYLVMAGDNFQPVLVSLKNNRVYGTNKLDGAGGKLRCEKSPDHKNDHYGYLNGKLVQWVQWPARPSGPYVPLDARAKPLDTGGSLADLPEPSAPQTSAEPQDDSELDGTDFAHPAWWRGNDYSVTVLCQKINAILDGEDDGRGVSSEPWETTRRRLIELVRSKG